MVTCTATYHSTCPAYLRGVDDAVESTLTLRIPAWQDKAKSILRNLIPTKQHEILQQKNQTPVCQNFSPHGDPFGWTALPCMQSFCLRQCASVCAGVQEQLQASQAQLAETQQSSAADKELLQQTHKKAADDLKQAKLDIQKVALGYSALKWCSALLQLTMPPVPLQSPRVLCKAVRSVQSGPTSLVVAGLICFSSTLAGPTSRAFMLLVH